MSFIHNLNIIQHHNNEIHKNLLELYNGVEERIIFLQKSEEELKKKEKEIKQREEDIKNFNKVSIIKSQDKKICTLERRLTRLSIKQEKENKKKTSKPKPKPTTEPEPEPKVEVEQEDEEFEVYVKKIGRKKYYVSNTDEVYTILDDEEVGDCVGVLKKNKLVKHKKK